MRAEATTHRNYPKQRFARVVSGRDDPAPERALRLADLRVAGDIEDLSRPRAALRRRRYADHLRPDVHLSLR